MATLELLGVMAACGMVILALLIAGLILVPKVLDFLPDLPFLSSKSEEDKTLGFCYCDHHMCDHFYGVRGCAVQRCSCQVYAPKLRDEALEAYVQQNVTDAALPSQLTQALPAGEPRINLTPEVWEEAKDSLKHRSSRDWGPY